MTRTFPYVLSVVAVIWLVSNAVQPLFDAVHRVRAASPDHIEQGKPMTHHATGTFEVKLLPLGEEDKAAGSTLARLSIDKQFHGGIAGTSKGEMLSAMTEVKGSAGYVAMERVTGTLDGLAGSFVLQHTATMTRGVPDLSITVVPDSGTGPLAGLTGRLSIKIAEGQHSYDFEYTLPAAP